MKNFPRLYQIGIRFPKTVFLSCLVLILLALYGAKNLRIENNLTALLPQSFQSVQALHEMEKTFGGLGFLVVVVEADQPDLAKKFADHFAQRISRLNSVQYVDYQRPVEYFQKRQWLFIQEDDLREMEKRVDRSLVLQEHGVSPIFNHLMDFADEEDRPDLTFQDIRQKYEKKYGFDTDELISTDDGKFIVFKVKSKAHQQNLDKSQSLIDDIRLIERELTSDPKYGSVVVQYTGDHVGSIETVQYLQKRMTWVSIVILAALFLVLFSYFRRFRPVFLVGFPLMTGIVWTGGAVYLLLGHLNVITGFGAGILAGLGSDYGIYMVTRFYQERDRGHDFKTACQRAFHNTGRASYASMVTTVFAFLALLFSDFGVTVEFGIVGALGLFLNYMAMMVVLPSMLTLGNEWRERRGRGYLTLPSRPLSYPRQVALKVIGFIFAPRGAIIGVVLTLGVIGLSALTLSDRSTIQFEDGRMDSLGLPGEKLYSKVAMLYGGTLQPTLLITQGVQEDEKTIQAFQEKLTEETKRKLPYREAIGLSTFVPDNQGEKRKILARLKGKFKKSKFPVQEKREELIASFQDSLHSETITHENLPPEVTRMFVSPLKKDVFAVYLFPNFKDLNWEWMEDYSDSVNSVKKENDLNFMAVDNPFVATEFVRMIEKEAPRMVVTTLGFLLLMLFWVARPVIRALTIFFHLLGGLVVLSGAMELFNIPLNTLNIAAFPIVLGTGIDCFIHFGLRYDETRDMGETIQNKLPTVLISNLTTIIGFGGLLFVPSPGLRSLGWAALLGLIIMTLFCAFVFPRVLLLTHGRGSPKFEMGEDPVKI